MGKKKIRIILILSVFILVLATGFTCQECLMSLSKRAEEVRKQTWIEFDSIKKKSPDEEREVSWVTEEPEKEETAPSKPEDVADLENYKEGSVSLKGKVLSPSAGFIELNIDFETGIVEGSIKDMGWTEEIITDDEESSEDHHHTRNCEVVFNGTFFGKIDENGFINANVVGYVNGKEGDCKQLVKEKPESFILNGNYYKNSNNAGGTTKPKGYSWDANKV